MIHENRNEKVTKNALIQKSVIALFPVFPVVIFVFLRVRRGFDRMRGC